MKDIDILKTRYHLPWLLACRVRILIVIDGSGGFDEVSGFSLGQVLKVLDDDPWLRVVFDVTKAHRGTSAEPDVVANFLFDSHDLTQYSQVWLFGVTTTGAPLSPTELKALSQFMDNGGGVFATGDHQNLGQPMCAEVPRVRSMRRWHFPNPGPNMEPVAPDQVGPARNDTVMNPGAGGNQSDAIPQPIEPHFYTRTTGGGIIRRVASFPHPVLCGPDGPITWLPDHMHEGLCEVPANLGQTWTFDGYACVEYPTVSGAQEIPEVIAKANDRNSGGRDFGVLAAYDGHRAGVGRVLVDATWHHWFNINLEGFIAATSGSSPDPVVVAQWEAIKAYFRNVALWLATPAKQQCFRNTHWIFSLRYYDLLMTHQPHLRVKDTLAYYWQMGVFARDSMGLLASRCQTTKWIVEVLEIFRLRFDPWPPIHRPPLPDPPPWLDIIDLENVALGGAIHELMNRYVNLKNPQDLLDRGGREIAAHAERGAAVAVGEFFKRQQVAGVEAAQFLKRLPQPKVAPKAAVKAPRRKTSSR